jgi:hypothetical protein
MLNWADAGAVGCLFAPTDARHRPPARRLGRSTTPSLTLTLNPHPSPPHRPPPHSLPPPQRRNQPGAMAVTDKLDQFKPKSLSSESWHLVVLVAGVGTVLEYFDFYIYNQFGAVISKVFFPSNGDPQIQQLSYWGVFAAAFVARPLGALIFGASPACLRLCLSLTFLPLLSPRPPAFHPPNRRRPPPQPARPHRRQVRPPLHLHRRHPGHGGLHHHHGLPADVRARVIQGRRRRAHPAGHPAHHPGACDWHPTGIWHPAIS